MEQTFQVCDVFNESAVNQLAADLSGAWQGFDAKRFCHVVNSQLKPLSFSERAEIKKRHSFRLINTRKYYSGVHRLEVQVNGKVYGGMDFELKQKI